MLITIQKFSLKINLIDIRYYIAYHLNKLTSGINVFVVLPTLAHLKIINTEM